MCKNRLTSPASTAMAILAVTLFVAGTPASGQQEKILGDLNNQHGAGYPRASLLFNAGTLYGTASQDGAYDNGGAVFALKSNAHGDWHGSLLHDFQNSNGNAGYAPFASLIADHLGNLYGTSVFGGNLSACPGGPGCGVVFELIPNSNGSWTEQVFHRFSGADGTGPYGSLIFDSLGNLYGTTASGAAQGCGTVFELIHKPGSSLWAYTVLHTFVGPEGCAPYAGLVFDSLGNLFGTTSTGGSHSNGTVFELTLNAGAWTETVLHNFNNDGTDGYSPQSALIFDGYGNLYSTTTYGGSSGASCGSSCGTVFELTPQGAGWTETILHSFNNDGTDGWWPLAGLLLDPSGNLYGTTGYGGNAPGHYGTAFQLTPANGLWTEKILHNFNDNGTDGLIPNAGLIFDSTGNLYGTTYSGGAGYGTVFEIVP